MYYKPEINLQLLELFVESKEELNKAKAELAGLQRRDNHQELLEQLEDSQDSFNTIDSQLLELRIFWTAVSDIYLPSR